MDHVLIEPSPLEGYLGMAAMYAAMATLEATLRIHQGAEDEPIARDDTLGLALASAQAALKEHFESVTSAQQRRVIARHINAAEYLSFVKERIKAELAGPMFETDYPTVQSNIADITDEEREEDFATIVAEILDQHPTQSHVDATIVAQELLDAGYRNGERPVRRLPFRVPETAAD